MYIYICIDTYIRIMYDMCDRHRFYIYVHMIYTRDVSSDHHPPLRPGFREIGRPGKLAPQEMMFMQISTEAI